LVAARDRGAADAFFALAGGSVLACALGFLATLAFATLAFAALPFAALLAAWLEAFAARLEGFAVFADAFAGRRRGFRGSAFFLEDFFWFSCRPWWDRV
jgi:hypothetical protein